MRIRHSFQKFSSSGHQIRFQRFGVESNQVKAIARHSSSRCSCFWLGIRNISRTGIAAEHIGLGFIPFVEEDILELTMDAGCRLFSRPIHISCVVTRREERLFQLGDVNHTVFGLHILNVEPRHINFWEEGLRVKGNPEQTEPVASSGLVSPFR